MLFLQLHLRGFGPQSIYVRLKESKGLLQHKLRPGLLGKGKPLPCFCISAAGTVLFYEAHERITGDAEGPGSASPCGQPSSCRHQCLLIRWPTAGSGGSSVPMRVNGLKVLRGGL